jgi:2-aminoadipate transaminase
MNLWIRLPDTADAAALLEKARARGVSYLPGKYFAVSREETGSLRISFAGLDPARIDQGLRILGEVFADDAALRRAHEAEGPAPALV